MIEYSMDDIIRCENIRFEFDIDKLRDDIEDWYAMLLRYGKGLSIMHNVNYVEVRDDKGLCFFSDPCVKNNFFGYDPSINTIRSCTIIEFEAFDKQTIVLENSPNSSVKLNDYLTSVVTKKFDKWTTKIHVGDLIWFRTRYYADDNHERVIDVSAVGFVTRYDEDMMSITYRDIDNTVSPEKVSAKNIDIYPDRLRMFDWYIIDENNKKEAAK